MDTKKTLINKHIKQQLNETKCQSNGGVFKAEETTEEGIGFLSAWLTSNRLANALLVHNDTAKSQN